MKQLFAIAILLFAFSATAQIDTPLKKTAWYIAEYGDSTDQAYQERGTFEQYPICFIGFKYMWMNTFCNNKVFRRNGYKQLDLTKQTKSYVIWEVTQNSFIGSGDMKPQKAIIKLFIDQNDRITKATIDAPREVLIQLFVDYWNTNNIRFEDVKNGGIATQTYLTDRITMVKNKSKNWQIEITQGLVTMAHN